MYRLNKTTDIVRHGRGAVIFAFQIFLLYAALRWLVYAALPADDFADWAVRDTLINGPRLLVLALSLHIGLRLWGKEGLGLHTRGWKPATFVFVVFCLLLWLPGAWLRTEPFELSAGALVLLTGSSVLVGCWEEILYRGVFFNAIREWKGAKAAVWGSSFLFTIMHIQAQPIAHWPSIFLFGMVAALLRLRGVGLIPLIAIHTLYDTLIFFGATGSSQILGLPAALFLLRAVFAFKYYHATKGCFAEEPPDAEPPEKRQKSETPAKAEPRTPELTPSPKPLTDAQRQHRLRELAFFARYVLEKQESYRVRLHITKVDATGLERDLGPWPDTVAEASRLEDATDLCSMLSHHLRRFLRSSHLP